MTPEMMRAEYVSRIQWTRAHLVRFASLALGLVFLTIACVNLLTIADEKDAEAQHLSLPDSGVRHD